MIDEYRHFGFSMHLCNSHKYHAVIAEGFHAKYSMVPLSRTRIKDSLETLFVRLRNVTLGRTPSFVKDAIYDAAALMSTRQLQSFGGREQLMDIGHCGYYGQV
jgi:hypothetical protein